MQNFSRKIGQESAASPRYRTPAVETGGWVSLSSRRISIPPKAKKDEADLFYSSSFVTLRLQSLGQVVDVSDGPADKTAGDVTQA